MDTYEVCWQIWRCNKDTSIKIAGTNCPCKYDPENNKKCPIYEPVIIQNCDRRICKGNPIPQSTDN